jgi:hypothetical protein
MLQGTARALEAGQSDLATRSLQVRELYDRRTRVHPQMSLLRVERCEIIYLPDSRAGAVRGALSSISRVPDQ